MIGKQTKGRGFRGLLNYLEEKEEAELIGGNMVGRNARELAAEFKFSRELNRKVERVVYHASLSLPKHERLDNKTWNAIAKDYLTRMGFDYNQYAVYRHHDRDHDHIHIIASRIKLDGTCVHDSWDYRRSEGVIRRIEKEYGLSTTITRDQGKRSPTVGEKRREEQTGEKSVREKLQAAIDRVAQSKPTMAKLIESLKQQGINAQVMYTRTEKVKGIVYGQDGITFSGTHLGRDYTFTGLQKHKGVDYNLMQDKAIQEASKRQLALLEPTQEQLVQEERGQQQPNRQQTKSKGIEAEYEF